MKRKELIRHLILKPAVPAISINSIQSREIFLR